MKTASPLMSRAFLSLALGALLLSPCQTACSPRGSDAPPPPSAEERFIQMDGNKDGKIDIVEFKAASPNMNEQAFGVIDLNKDGGIDQAEWIEFANNHGKSMKSPSEAPVMNNIPGDPLIPPVDSSDLPLMRPSGI